MKTLELTEDDTEAISALLVGHKVVAAETGSFTIVDRWHSTASGRLTLDDGREIFVAPNQGGCSCSQGDYQLAKLAAVDNIITAVRLAGAPSVDTYTDEPNRYEIFVVADAVEINLLTVEGDDGNGCYGTGYSLIIADPS